MSLHASIQFSSVVDPRCRAIVIVPVRNEEHTLRSTLDALRAQKDAADRQLAWRTYEVLLLLNNCTDRSGQVAAAFQQQHPEMRLLIAHQTLPADVAHVGTARRLLMESACRRLAVHRENPGAILSTDADTIVGPNWVERSLHHLDQGADVVGGVIQLHADDLEDMARAHPKTHHAYHLDRVYQSLVARLESLFDPDVHDPWPRHLEHFGASLACTQEIYERAGGLPSVKHLEDVAFIDAVRRVDGRIRHAPDVLVKTSGRLHGRVEVGLSGQLRCWRDACNQGTRHMVPGAEWLKHRFTSMANLRSLHRSQGQDAAGIDRLPQRHRRRILDLCESDLTEGMFLAQVDADRLAQETFCGGVAAARDGQIAEVIKHLRVKLARHTRAHPADTAPTEDDGRPDTPDARPTPHAPDHRSEDSPAPLVSNARG